MKVRAVRGATTVESNTSDEIIRGAKELLSLVIDTNKIEKEDIISIIFTVTHDLNAAFPAAAARQLGYTDIALMCMNEINVPGSPEKCIRIMLHFNSEKPNSEIKNIYLNGAKVLRPDLVK